eukprot:1231031-Amphidinium_carterae.1
MLASLGVAYGCLGDAAKECDCFERALHIFASLGLLPLAHQHAKSDLRFFEASCLGAGHPGALAVKTLLAKIERQMLLQASQEPGAVAQVPQQDEPSTDLPDQPTEVAEAVPERTADEPSLA